MADNQALSKSAQGQRLKQLYKKLRLSQAKLAEVMDTDQVSISMAVTGKRYVQEVWLYKLKETHSNVNFDWVLTGEGEMFLHAPGESPGDGLMEPDVAYVKGQARALSSEEVAVILARMQKEVADARAWRDEMERRLEDVSRRLEGIISGD